MHYWKVNFNKKEQHKEQSKTLRQLKFIHYIHVQLFLLQM